MWINYRNLYLTMSILVTFQFQLVKYLMVHNLTAFSLFTNFQKGMMTQIHLKLYFWSFCCFGWTHTFFALRTWCPNSRNIWRWTHAIRLVFTVYWNATNVHGVLIKHSTSDEDAKLCKYYSRARNNEKGINYWYNGRIQAFSFWLSISDNQQCFFILYDHSSIWDMKRFAKAIFIWLKSTNWTFKA